MYISCPFSPYVHFMFFSNEKFLSKSTILSESLTFKDNGIICSCHSERISQVIAIKCQKRKKCCKQKQPITSDRDWIQFCCQYPIAQWLQKPLLNQYNNKQFLWIVTLMVCFDSILFVSTISCGVFELWPT